MIAMIVATVLHLPLCMLFVHVLEMGLPGLAVATSCKDFIGTLILEVYCSRSETVKGSLQSLCQASTFMGWKEYMAVSLPAIVMICAEWWGF